MKLSLLFSLSLSPPNEYGMHDGEHEKWDAGDIQGPANL